MRVTNANSYSDSYRDCVGTISYSDFYGYGYGYGYSTYTDGYGYGNVDGCYFSNSDWYRNGNGNGDCDAHAAAYPDAEDGSDTNAAPDSDAIALAATDATLIGTIQAGTREQNSRVPCL